MTRVVAGTYGGRRLQVPRGAGTRPTAERAREGLFSTLQSLVDLEGARVLDLYAGSGALGLEALSRGASAATLVESDPKALLTLRANVAALQAPAEVVDAEVSAFLGRGGSPYRLVLLDPPYDTDVDPVLALLGPWVDDEGVVVVERASRGEAPTPPAELVLDRSRRYGEATLWYFRRP